MKPEKKQISAALIEHLEREELHSGQAAAFLNLNPCYISMAKNEKSWDAMGKKTWDRLEEWFNTRENIKDFKIPEGEEIWKKPERDPAARITKPDVSKVKKERKEVDEHSPEVLIKAKKEHNGKNVQLIINTARFEAIDKQIADLKEENKKLLKGLQESEHYYELLKDNYDRLAQEQFVLIDETIPVILSRLDSLKALPESLENLKQSFQLLGAAQAIHTLPIKEKSPKGIVIFQRNYYSK